MAVNDLQMVQTIELGRQGENFATILQFDISDFVSEYGNGQATLIHRRAGDARPYIVPATQNGNYVEWEVSSVDTFKSGTGAAEIRWWVNGVIAKSAVFNTYVIPSIMDDTTEQPGNIVYMISSPDGEGLEIIETDPTVPAWAKEPRKPTYTASEVGAAQASHTHTSSAITDADTEATNGSNKLVTSGAAYTAGNNARQYTQTSNSASKKLFIVGAETQGARQKTNSNVNCYIGADNKLYSNGHVTVNDDFQPTYQNFGNNTIPNASTWTPIATKTGLGAGKYLIMAYCQVASAASGRYMARIMKNGTEIQEFGNRAAYDSSLGAWAGFTAFAFAEVAAGDAISVEGNVSVAGTTINVRISTIKLA